jgi:tetratricopeptide (TPR) repeat protein
VPLENAARATYQLSRFRESAELYEQLLQIAPGRLDLLKTLGSVYLYDLDDRPAALAVFRRALARESDPEEKEKLQELITELGG